MARKRKSKPLLHYDYMARTREWPVNLLFLMPWVLVYELALFGTQSPVENAAAAWLRALGRGLGRESLLLLLLLTSLALLLVVVLRLRDATRDSGVFGGMVAEGLLYGAVLGTVAGFMATMLPMERVAGDAGGVTSADVPLAMEQMKGTLREFGLAIGAGVFEELIFRGLLCFGLWTVLRHVVGADRITAGFVAVLVSAYIFSDYHHWGVGGEPYDATIFAFRFHAGLVLGAIFLTRGLGIAAFAHGFYDVLALLNT